MAELDRAGINVCFAQDSIQDPWYPLGNGNILRILDAGLHICHMLGYDDLQRCLDFVTDNSARALCLGDNYGLAEGRPANLLILDAENDYEAVRRQARVLTSIRHGKVILQREVEHKMCIRDRANAEKAGPRVRAVKRRTFAIEVRLPEDAAAA